jgi:Tol biopolymer transport system component
VPPGYYKPIAVKQLTTDLASYPSLNANGTTRYYNLADGKFYGLAADGTSKLLANQVFYNVNQVTWANTKNEAVLEYPDGSKIIYDFEKQKQVTLPSHWEDFAFSPDSSQVAAKSVGLSPDNRWLITVKDDGTAAKIIEPMGENGDKVNVNWSPSGQTVAFAKTADPIGGGVDRQEILLVGQNHENFKGLAVEGLGFEPNWSKTGQKLIYSVYSARSNFSPELWVVNAYGDKIGSGRMPLSLNTWASKCAFADDSTIYCAVPQTLPQGSGMEPSIVASDDDLYRVNINTGLRTPIDLGGSYRVSSMSFDSATNRLIFTDARQSGVFEVKL